MSLKLYDDALVNKIQSWVKDKDLTILRPDDVVRLFQMKADMGKDKPLKLPFISIARNKETTILNISKQPKTYNGIVLERGEEKSKLLNAIPIKLGYQLDIYTKGMEEADAYVRNFVFNIINYPKLSVTIPYNGANLQHDSSLYLSESITDNSDIPQRLYPDQFVRFTLELFVDDAYLFSVPYNRNYTLEGAELCVNNDKTEIVEKSIIF